VQAAQLVGAVPQRIEPELAVEPEVLKGLAEGIEPQALAHGPIVGEALGLGELGEIAPNQDLLQDLGRDLGRGTGERHGREVRVRGIHGLVLCLQAGLDEPVDGVQAALFPGVLECPVVDGELAIEQPIDHREQRVLLGVGLLRQRVLDGAAHVADIEGFEGEPPAFLVMGGGVIDIEIRGIGDMTS